jgi:DNA-binding transcriptional MerR regulator
MTELCEWSAATPRQVEHWCRSGIIVPLQDSEGRGQHRVFSLQNVIEAAMARELQKAKISPVQLKSVFAQHRQTLSDLSPELRPSATFVHFVKTVDALVKHFNGQWPEYPYWCKDVAAFIRSWGVKTAL